MEGASHFGHGRWAVVHLAPELWGLLLSVLIFVYLLAECFSNEIKGLYLCFHELFA